MKSVLENIHIGLRACSQVEYQAETKVLVTIEKELKDKNGKRGVKNSKVRAGLRCRLLKNF